MVIAAGRHPLVVCDFFCVAFYGDDITGPNILPHHGQSPPDYLPFPGGNPLRPSIRSNFRSAPDPVHLSQDGYEYKITTETLNYFLSLFRDSPALTLSSQGGTQDGWSNGATVGTDSVYLGDDGASAYAGIISFDTAGIPERAIFTAASLYPVREAEIGSNPFESSALGAATLDIALGSFGNPEVEVSDATTPSDTTDVGCIYGSAKDTYYALRADVTATGLTAIDKQGLTQFRLAFPGSDGGSSDRVEFYTGDGVLPAQAQRMKSKKVTFEEPLPNGTTYRTSEVVTSIDHAGLAEFRESVSPFLDIDYCLAPDSTTVSISQNEGTLSLTCPPAADAIAYEVWTDGGNPYFEPGDSCEADADCTVTAETRFSPTPGTPGFGLEISYLVRARNDCAGGAISAASNTTAEFVFELATASS